MLPLVGAQIPSPGWGSDSIAFDGRAVWALSAEASTITKVDIDTRTIVQVVPLPAGPESLAFDGANMWVTCWDADALVKIDVRSNQAVETIALPAGSNPDDLAFDGKFMWVNAQGTRRIHKFLVRF